MQDAIDTLGGWNSFLEVLRAELIDGGRIEAETKECMNVKSDGAADRELTSYNRWIFLQFLQLLVFWALLLVVEGGASQEILESLALTLESKYFDQLCHDDSSTNQMEFVDVWAKIWLRKFYFC